MSKITIKQVWNHSPKKKRKELLKVLGYKTEWAKLSWDSIAKSGGGMLLADLTKLNKIRNKGKKK